MRSDPIPNHVIVLLDSECAVMQANSGRPQVAYLFECESRMPRISLQLGK